jgi:hypothetical protein
MTTHIYSSVLFPLRISLVMMLLLVATSVDVAAQQPSISVREVQVVEGNSGTTQATFVVALSAPAAQSVSFTFATADGTATAGSDYTATSGGPVTFAPGEVEKPVVVLVNGDTVDEGQETFFLDISNVQNATVSSSRRAEGMGSSLMMMDQRSVSMTSALQKAIPVRKRPLLR